MKRAKKILSVMLAMCLTTIMICGNTADAKTTYVKSFTKTITVKAGYQYYIKMNFKKASNVSVKITPVKAQKDRSLAVLVGDETNSLFITPNIETVTLKGKYKKGDGNLIFGNHATKATKVKVTVTSKSATVGYVSGDQSNGEEEAG